MRARIAPRCLCRLPAAPGDQLRAASNPGRGLFPQRQALLLSPAMGEGLRCGPGRPSRRGARGEQCLNRLERLPFDNRGMTTEVNHAPASDLADVRTVLQLTGQRDDATTPGLRDPTVGQGARIRLDPRRVPLRDDSSCRAKTESIRKAPQDGRRRPELRNRLRGLATKPPKAHRRRLRRRSPESITVRLRGRRLSAPDGRMSSWADPLRSEPGWRRSDGIRRADGIPPESRPCRMRRKSRCFVR